VPIPAPMNDAEVADCVCCLTIEQAKLAKARKVSDCRPGFVGSEVHGSAQGNVVQGYHADSAQYNLCSRAVARRRIQHSHDSVANAHSRS
jgi:hypothetical protein